MICRRFRRLIEGIILCGVGLLFFKTWFVLGLPVFCEIQGGSMAPCLLGRHIEFACPSCGFLVICDALDVDGTLSVVCPNCDYNFAMPTPGRALSGDRLLIDRTAFQARAPRRWEIVAFHRVSQSAELFVKRIVGLPGETIQIIDGDVYANWQIQRKPLRQQRALRIMVHDDECPGIEPRWYPREVGSNWARQHGHLVHAENTGDDIGWIVYDHAKSGVNAPQTSKAVTDYDFYSRGRLQRSEAVHPMADIAMSFRVVELHGRGLLSLHAGDGRDDFMVQINPGTKKYVVLKNWQKNPQTVIASSDLPGPIHGQTIEVSLFDRQFLFAIAGRTLVTENIDTRGPPPLTDQPLAIGVQGLGVMVDRLRVYRDVYYTDPPFVGSRSVNYPIVLAEGEYFVLGDNSTISEDSRTWRDERFVSRRSIVGKPFVVIFPARGISLHGWQSEVPDLGRIRYIR
jgi:signal peptidase I